ncbi:MAG: A/G-specific adenine glycosylase [Myxococcota bacterium]
MTNLRERLLSWYDRAGRDLPWRRSRDPYAIWVSEVMLQQTRVDTVIPYYHRFLGRFPSAAALADADEDEVLAAWSGLGYYRRARLLHRGVREVVARYGGLVPEDPKARRALPGVGRYTAGAIGSIAFDREEPIVDGNVSRVFARLFRIDSPLGATATTQRLWDEAEKLVRGPRPGDLNQALMELGAMVCTPKGPDCASCPLTSDCRSFGTSDATRLPIKATKKPPRRLSLCAVVATSGRGRDKEVWLIKGRAALFGGLWGLPISDAGPKRALDEAGLRARLRPEPSDRITHVLTHRRLEVDVYLATGAKPIHDGPSPYSAKSLATVGTSTLTRRVLSLPAVRFTQGADLAPQWASG